MYSRPSTEVIVAPCALRKKTGVPPTPLNARTGLCTPPGVMRVARSKYFRERSSVVDVACLGIIALREFNRRDRGGSSQSYAEDIVFAASAKSSVSSAVTILFDGLICQFPSSSRIAHRT